MSDELRLTDALTRLTDNGTTRVELVFHPQQDKYVGQRWQVRSGDARGVMTDRGWSPDDPAEALGQALGVPVVERDDAAELIAQLAECFRLSGADPDGNEDWRLARSAVAEVRQLREEYDELMLREEELVKALAGIVADLRSLMKDQERLREAADLLDKRRRRIQELESVLRELRTRLHIAGRRPEECWEMSQIDAALAAVGEEA